MWGAKGSNGACSTLHQILATPSATHNQIGPLWCWFPSGWACAHSRPLWVSPPTSPVRLGVSPAASPTPRGIFNQRFEASPSPTPRWSPGLHGLLISPPFVRFISLLMWGRWVLPAALPAPFSTTLSPVLSVYLCAKVGLHGLLVVRLPAPFVPHCASLSPAAATGVLSPRCPSLPLLLVWMYVSFLSTWCRSSLPFNFLSVLVVRGGAVCLPMPPSWFFVIVGNIF